MTQPPRRWLRHVRALAWIGVLLWISAATALWLAPDLVGRFTGGHVPQKLGLPAAVAPPFELIDHDGRPFSNHDLAGRSYLLFFGFTHCPDVCPTTLAWISQHLAELGPAAAPLRVVFVSVDPERDTPDVLKDYVAAFDSRIVGLTGTTVGLKAMADRWGIYVRKVPLPGRDYTIDHTASVFLVGDDGRLRSTLDIHDETPGVNASKLKRLVGKG